MNHRTRFRSLLLTLLTASALVVGGQFTVGAANAAPPPPPASMAALGDSITLALDSCGYRACPQYSWATGTSMVNSHAQRLRAVSPGLVTYNDAVSGVASAALLGQAQQAVAQGAQYVTIEIGANDACTPTVAAMTPTASFSANIAAGLAALAAGAAHPRIFVASIPNLQRLWEVNKSKLLPQIIWSAGKVCQSMLASPTSTKAADVARRAAVQQRVTEYNAALAAACIATAGCTFDGNALANYQFTASDISVLDYFHPSVSGQAKIAALTWPVSPYGTP